MNGSFSYPPVASITTSSAPCWPQKEASSWMPSAVRSTRTLGPSGPMRASNVCEETSTPQMMFVTVTCLARTIAVQATVRSCVTTAAVPKLTHGCCLRGYGRRPPRAGTGGRRSPRSTALITPQCRFPDTRGSSKHARTRGKSPSPQPSPRKRGEGADRASGHALRHSSGKLVGLATGGNARDLVVDRLSSGLFFSGTGPGRAGRGTGGPTPALVWRI